MPVILQRVQLCQILTDSTYIPAKHFFLITHQKILKFNTHLRFLWNSIDFNTKPIKIFNGGIIETESYRSESLRT
jgi:hypothetical protein